MKRLVVTAIVAVIAIGCGTAPDLTRAQESETKHVHVREYPGATKAQIYDALIHKAAASTRSPDQIREKDADKGIVIMRGSFPFKIGSGMSSYWVVAHAVITMEAKEGKARFNYDDLRALAINDHEHDPAVGASSLFHQNVETVTKAWEDGIVVKNDASW